MEMATTSSFISAMSSAVTGVSIITTNGSAGRFGVTVSAVSSVSAEPPIVLACINRKSPAVEAISGNGQFCVNFLNAEQSHLSDCFSGRPGVANPYEFKSQDWDEVSNSLPVLRDASANFVCNLLEAYDAGTHKVMLGLVQLAHHTDNVPLAYAQRAYHEPKLLNPIHCEGIEK